MRRILYLLLVLVFSLPAAAAGKGSAWDFTFESIDGSPLPLSQYRGKAVLVVNTASMCAYTPQYEGLQALWEKYRDRGLVVLGVPSNDFGGQEPGKAEEIKRFCEVNFAVDFPLTEKQVVRGSAAHPFYRWIESELGRGAVPQWNFHKILIGPDGRPAAVFPTAVEPGSRQVTRVVEAVLATAK